MSEVIEINSLTFTYPDGTTALRQLSFEIPCEAKVAVLGPNGAGKSTLFLHLNGILKPREGYISIRGNRIKYDLHSLKQLRQQVGIVFQDPDSMLFSANVMQEISFGPLNLGLPAGEVRKRVDAAAKAAGISNLLDKPAHHLSCGQKKRVTVASVLAMEPEIIIFDEPTAYLDPGSTRQLISLLDELNKKGRTIILSTHDTDFAFSWADYILVLDKGRLVGGGTPLEIFSNDILMETTGLSCPLVLEVYQNMVDKGLITASPDVPRNKTELFNLLPEKHI